MFAKFLYVLVSIYLAFVASVDRAEACTKFFALFCCVSHGVRRKLAIWSYNLVCSAELQRLLACCRMRRRGPPRTNVRSG